MSKPGAGDRRFAAIYAAIKDYDYRHAMALCERREVANLPLAKVREDDDGRGARLCVAVRPPRL